MSDEGFHEIQLGGKQLVFLFMAAAVVGVVLFLSGVMVGRGVRNEKAAAAGGPAPVAADLVAASAEPPSPPAGGAARPAQPAGDQASTRPSAPPATAPPPVADDIARPATTEVPNAAMKTPAPPAPMTDKNAAAAPAREPGAKPAPAASPAKPDSAAKTPPRTPEAAADAYSVQVAAARDRASAEAIAKRLVGKGYAAYVVNPSAGSPPPIYYKVRVGPFKSRGEADDVRRRLEKEEQFKPFITR